MVSLLWTEKSAVFCRRQRELDTASPEILDTGTQIIKKQKEKPQNRDLVFTSTRESSIVVVLVLFCGFNFFFFAVFIFIQSLLETEVVLSEYVVERVITARLVWSLQLHQWPFGKPTVALLSHKLI